MRWGNNNENTKGTKSPKVKNTKGTKSPNVNNTKSTKSPTKTETQMNEIQIIAKKTMEQHVENVKNVKKKRNHDLDMQIEKIGYFRKLIYYKKILSEIDSTIEEIKKTFNNDPKKIGILISLFKDYMSLESEKDVNKLYRLKGTTHTLRKDYYENDFDPITKKQVFKIDNLLEKVDCKTFIELSYEIIRIIWILGYRPKKDGKQILYTSDAIKCISYLLRHYRLYKSPYIVIKLRNENKTGLQEANNELSKWIKDEKKEQKTQLITFLRVYNIVKGKFTYKRYDR